MKKVIHAEKLLREVGCSADVIDHSRAVRDLSLLFSENLPVDRELIEAGAMLHDIGRSKTHTIAHAQVGADICRKLGLSEEIARIVECHIGAGLTAEECVKEGLRPIDCVPQTPEEKIVANADNLVRGTEVITIDERLRISGNLSEKIRKRMLDLAIEVSEFIVTNVTF